MHSRLILQVHDELIVDALRCEAERVKEILRREMESVGVAAGLSVPLTVDVGVGNNWLEAH